MIGSLLHGVSVNGRWLGLLRRWLRRLHHTGIRGLDDVVIQIGHCLEHMWISKVVGARGEGRLSRGCLGGILCRPWRIGSVLLGRLRGEWGCQCVCRVCEMGFIELNLGDTNTVGVDMAASKHGSIGEFVAGRLGGTWHAIVRQGPFKGVGVDVLVWMRDWHGGVLCLRRPLLRLLAQCDRA